MSDGKLEYAVVDWPKGMPLPASPLPNGDAYEVPDDTPLSDWKASPPQIAETENAAAPAAASATAPNGELHSPQHGPKPGKGKPEGKDS